MIRTRFAPSPTGYLHIGGLRTALYSYLFARQNHGKFLLRIEDTDQKRYVEGAVENLLKTLQTMGISYDEGPDADGGHGPYVQSERTEIYREHLQKLLDQKAAYCCFCTAERLEEMRQKQIERKKAPMYDRACLNLSTEDIASKMKEGVPFVVRQLIPQGKKLKFKDLVRGTVVFDTSTIDDQVLMKSDNFPTYHLANVVDDHLMEISHVIRGEEWLPSTPKHILLYESFGWKPPEFAHLPLLLNKDKSKLSKRQGDVSVESYLEKGYSREALINFVALLGWHPGSGKNQEVFSMEELTKNFSLEKVHKAGAVFDLEKLNWFNFQWQKRIHMEKMKHLALSIDPESDISTNDRGNTNYGFTTPEAEQKFSEERGKMLFDMCSRFLPEEWASSPLILRALITVEEKILRTPADVKEHIAFYFQMKEYPKDLLLNAKMEVDETTAQKALEETVKKLKSQDEKTFQSQATIQKNLLQMIAGLGLKNGQVLWPARVALTGEQYSPGVFELIWVLGKNEAIQRMTDCLERHFKN